MTDNTTLARPYAKAAFEAAKAVNQSSAWSLALRKLSLVVTDPQMKLILKNPNCSQEKSCELLLDILRATNAANGSASASDRETQTTKEIKNFIQLLAEKRRLPILPNISELFEEDCAKESKYISLNVTSAFSMDDQQRNIVTEKLSKQLNSELKIDFHVDADLIGGLLVRSRNWVLDDTIKGKLARLKSVLL